MANQDVLGLLDNVLSHWKLDEASGTRVDATATGNDLTDNNTVTQATGIQGGCAFFDIDNTEFLSSTTDPGVTADWSVSFWIYQAAVVNTWALSSGDGSNKGFGVKCESTGKIFVQFGTTSTVTKVRTNSAVINSTDTWFHVVVTADVSGGAGGIVIYVDGSSVGHGTVSDTATTIDALAATHLGANNGSETLDGRLDEVTLTNDVITSGEVTSLYNSGSGIPYSDSTFTNFLAFMQHG